MNLTLQRLEPFGAALHGDLYAEGRHVCVTLENVGRAIPAGRYQIVMTPSGRAQTGSLWSPRADHKLPLLCDVAGREGIRVHAGNAPDDVEGCIAVGMVRDGGEIHNSRVSVISVMAILDAALSLNEAVFVDVLDAP